MQLSLHYEQIRWIFGHGITRISVELFGFNMDKPYERSHDDHEQRGIEKQSKKLWERLEIIHGDPDKPNEAMFWLDVTADTQNNCVYCTSDKRWVNNTKLFES